MRLAQIMHSTSGEAKWGAELNVSNTVLFPPFSAFSLVIHYRSRAIWSSLSALLSKSKWAQICEDSFNYIFSLSSILLMVSLVPK
jgi:hypothetical protein